MSSFLYQLWPYLAGGLVGWLLSGLLSHQLKYSPPPTKQLIEKEITLEKIIDNPNHLALISKLEAENTKIDDLKAQIYLLTTALPKVIDNPIHITKIDALEEELTRLKSQQAPQIQATNPAHFTIDPKIAKDDFTIITGINNSVENLLHNAGIYTYEKLALSDIKQLQEILISTEGYTNLKTWPAQAELATHQQWSVLKTWQTTLGKYHDK